MSSSQPSQHRADPAPAADAPSTSHDAEAAAARAESFPRRMARTQRFTLGVPRSFTISRDGQHVLFLRSMSGTDRLGALWQIDRDSGTEHLVVDPAKLLDGSDEELGPEERARRERLREGSGGIVAYATDDEPTVAAFALSGRLYATSLTTRQTRELPTATPVVDPRPDPTGRHIAYVAAGALRVHDLSDHRDRALAEPDGEDVTWGLAEFIAAEEMDRFRGYWWSPDGERLLATRVDNAPVQRWTIADPANPDRPATRVPYPAAGTANADVSLALLDLTGRQLAVEWDRSAYPYLVQVRWSPDGPPLLTVQSRDQRRIDILAIDTTTGATRTLRELTDPVWIERTPGTPDWTPDGRLLTVEPSDDTHRLMLDGHPVTPPGLQIRAVLDVDDDSVLLTASTDDPTETHVFLVPLPTTADGATSSGNNGPTPAEATTSATEPPRLLTPRPGVHSATRRGGTLLLASSTLVSLTRETVIVPADAPHDDARTVPVASVADPPGLAPSITFHTVGARALPCALLLPTGHTPGTRLPVLLDPYGGPHAQRAVKAAAAHLTSQWFADQGFAVLVADGRGTPGRGPAWERAIAHDFAGATLDDQVDALHAVAADHPDLDLSRVAIRGWSYGGYLAALAVLRRPDVFHAAVAGAPVTDWRLYDTHYTERYLGHPDDDPDVYTRNSLLAEAPNLRRPLLLIHGLADDNVVAAHTLRLSSALLAAGRPHTVLPLSGVTHMTPQEVVAENLMLLQVEFLKRALGMAHEDQGQPC